MTQVTNTLIDDRITAQTAPLTRVTDVDTEFPVADNTDELPIEFTTDDGNTLYMTYNEFNEDSIWENYVFVADGLSGVLDLMDDAIDTANTYIGTLTPPITGEQYAHLVRLLQVPGLNPIKGV